MADSFKIIDTLNRHRQTSDKHSTFSWTSTLQNIKSYKKKIDSLTEDLVLNDRNTKNYLVPFCLNFLGYN